MFNFTCDKELKTDHMNEWSNRWVNHANFCLEMLYIWDENQVDEANYYYQDMIKRNLIYDC